MVTKHCASRSLTRRRHREYLAEPESHGFGCAADRCRKRTTPPSQHFLGRRDYFASVVTLILAVLHGTAAALLSVVLGIDSRTIARWRAGWVWSFADSAFYGR